MREGGKDRGREGEREGEREREKVRKRGKMWWEGGSVKVTSKTEYTCAVCLYVCVCVNVCDCLHAICCYGNNSVSPDPGQSQGEERGGH